MPTTLTLKNIPDDVCERLKLSAEAHSPKHEQPSDRVPRGHVVALQSGAGRKAGASTRTARHLAKREIPRLYLPGDRTAQAEALLEQDADRAAPVLWRSEFRNILAGYLRRKTLTVDQACSLQAEAESLLAGAEFEVDSNAVLAVVRDSTCSAYDCEFVALAIRLNTRLVTVDRKLLQGFPTRTIALAVV